MMYFIIILLFNVVGLSYQCESLYDITINKIEMMPEVPNGVLDVNGLEVEHFNKTAIVLNGIVVINADLTADTLAHVVCFEKTANGYKQSALQWHQSVCEIMQTDNKVVKDLAEHLKITQDTCPLPQGPYDIVDYKPDVSCLPPGLAPKEWKVDISIESPDKSNLGGITVYVTLKNKSAL